MVRMLLYGNNILSKSEAASIENRTPLQQESKLHIFQNSAAAGSVSSTVEHNEQLGVAVGQHKSVLTLWCPAPTATNGIHGFILDLGLGEMGKMR